MPRKSILKNRSHQNNFKTSNIDGKKTNYFTKFALPTALLVVGGIVTYFGQIIFSHANRQNELEATVYPAQYEYLVHILKFTEKYKIVFVVPVTHVITIKYDSHNNFIPIDSSFETLTGQGIHFPSFVAVDSVRKMLLSDVAYIQQNSDKIDFRTYQMFEELVNILNKYPLPKNSKFKELKNSPWHRKDVQEMWQEQRKKLFQHVHSRLYDEDGTIKDDGIFYIKENDRKIDSM